MIESVMGIVVCAVVGTAAGAFVTFVFLIMATERSHQQPPPSYHYEDNRTVNVYQAAPHVLPAGDDPMEGLIGMATPRAALPAPRDVLLLPRGRR